MKIELDQPPHEVNVLVFCDHIMRHIMAYVTPDLRQWRLLLNFCGKDTSQSSRHWPRSWVTEGPTLRATSSVRCVSSWAFRKQELCHTTPRLTGRWSKLTKCWCGWLENWVKSRRQPGWGIYQNWCMLTIPQDQPSPDTAHTIWCLGDDCAYLLIFIFPLLWAQKNTSMSTPMLLIYMSNCTRPSRKCKHSLHLRMKGRGNTMIIKLMPFHWNLVTWSWLKLTPTNGGERWTTSVRRNCMKWNAELLKVSLPTSWRTSGQNAHKSPTRIDFFSLSSYWELLYVQVYGLSRQGVPPPSWRSLLRKWVRMRKCHKVQSVCHQPRTRQVRLL